MCIVPTQSQVKALIFRTPVRANPKSTGQVMVQKVRHSKI